MTFDIIIFLLPFFFANLIAAFNGAQESWADEKWKTIFWRHNEDWYRLIFACYKQESFRFAVRNGDTGYSTFDLWLIGGNKWYPPNKPLGGDFWHKMKKGWIVSIGLTGIALFFNGYFLAVEVTDAGWSLHHLWYLLYVLIPPFIGIGFTFYYHYLFIKGARFTDWFRGFILGQHQYT